MTEKARSFDPIEIQVHCVQIAFNQGFPIDESTPPWLRIIHEKMKKDPSYSPRPEDVATATLAGGTDHPDPWVGAGNYCDTSKGMGGK